MAAAVIGGVSGSALSLEHSMDELATLAPTVMRAADSISSALGHLP